MKDEKMLRQEEIEKEIELMNIHMKSKRFDRYSKEEKIDYINKMIKLLQELKPLVGFLDQFLINKVIYTLEYALKKVKESEVMR